MGQFDRQCKMLWSCSSGEMSRSHTNSVYLDAQTISLASKIHISAKDAHYKIYGSQLSHQGNLK